SAESASPRTPGARIRVGSTPIFVIDGYSLAYFHSWLDSLRRLRIHTRCPYLQMQRYRGRRSGRTVSLHKPWQSQLCISPGHTEVFTCFHTNLTDRYKKPMNDC